VGYSLGFDLGTTFTAAAVVRGGRAEMVSLGNHAVTIPSVVFLRDDGELLVGDAADRRSVQEPARAARAFKRRFGDAAPIILDRTPFSADRLMAAVLTQVLADVVKRQGGAPDAVAVTHPANWGAYKLDLLRQAVTAAGVGTATLVPEPVAAAVQYASTERVEVGDVVAVYDLGGGTFDAAVLRKTATGFETIGRPEGIERLGGIDFDEAVMAHVRATLGDALDRADTSDPATREALAALRAECVAAKETLSSDSDATIPVNLPAVRTQVRLTRNEFEDVVRPMVRETVQALRRAVQAAGVEPAQLKAVLLAGGSSRIPLVGELVSSELGRPVVNDSHPKHTVAMGAARVAAATLAPAPSAAPPPPPPPARPPAAVPPPPGAPAPSAASVSAPPAPPAPLVATPPAAPSRAKRPAVVYAAAAAAGVAAVVIGVLVVGGGDDKGGTTASTGATNGVETSQGSATTLGSSEAATTLPVMPSGEWWSATNLPAVVADLDTQIPGEPTQFVLISVLASGVNVAVPAATPGSYEQYSWTDYGVVSGPTVTDVDAGALLFTAADVDWTAVGAQVAAAPSILGMPNGQTISVVATSFDGENVRVAITLAEGSVTKYVLVDTEGQVVATGP
jgi:actin-like ATPase involved in cell morphogenesis